MKRTNLLMTAYVSAWVAFACSQSGPNATSSSNSSSGGSSSSSSTSSDTGGTSQTSSSSGDQSSGGTSQTSSNSDSKGAGGSDSSSDTGSGDNAGGADSTSEPPSSDAGGSSSNTSGPVVGKGGQVGKGGAASTPAATTKAPAGGAGPAAGGAPTGAGGSSAVATTAAQPKGGAAAGGAPASGGSSSTTTTDTPKVEDVVPDLAKGFYWEGTCKGSTDPKGRNCFLTADSNCPSNGINNDISQTVGGVKDQLYTVNFEVRGVIGTRCYQDGKRASTAAPSEDGNNNWWYVGGTPYNSTGWWNTYELHVTPSTGDASKDVYYFNGSDVGGGTYCEKEGTYLVKYTASFKVKGGGSLQFRIHDQNCKAQQNCGKPLNSGDETCNSRSVDLSGMAVQPPSTFKQPPVNTTNKAYYPQWLWVVATSVSKG